MYFPLILAVVGLATAAPSTSKNLAALNTAVFDGIPDQYIVRYKSQLSAASEAAIFALLKEEPIAKYGTLISGFAAKMDAETLQAVREHPDVDFIDQDGIAKATFMEEMNDTVTQDGATWGISRVSAQGPGAKAYKYHSSAGEGTCSYIIDTGIDDTHPDFGGRAKMLKNFAGGSAGDKHGHGTHCAGTIGSTTYGVAKKTKLFGIKVLGDNASGSFANIISGMEFVATDYKKQDCPKGAMANLSLGGGKTQSVNDAANALSKAGVFTGVAAGNDNKDAANYSPASASDVCTIGATDAKDARSSFSNFGSTVEVFGPGTQVESTKTGGGMVRQASNW